MKPVIELLLTMVLRYFIPSLGKNVFQVTLRWKHDVSDADYYGWRVHYSEEKGGPYKRLGDDILYAGGSCPEFYAEQREVSKKERTTYYFVVIGMNTLSRTTKVSNEVAATADFGKPGVQFNLRATIALEYRRPRGSLKKKEKGAIES